MAGRPDITQPNTCANLHGSTVIPPTNHYHYCTSVAVAIVTADRRWLLSAI